MSLCGNHLSELYAAVKAGDIDLMDKVEHELTEEEKCVACTYVLKTHGTVREALERFFNDSTGEIVEKETFRSILAFWGLRLGMFFVILGIVVFGAAIFRVALFREAFSVVSFNVLEYTVIAMTSLVIFLFIDDLFFD